MQVLSLKALQALVQAWIGNFRMRMPDEGMLEYHLLFVLLPDSTTLLYLVEPYCMVGSHNAPIVEPHISHQLLQMRRIFTLKEFFTLLMTMRLHCMKRGMDRSI